MTSKPAGGTVRPQTGQWVMAAGTSTPRRGKPRRAQVRRRNGSCYFVFFFDIFIFFTGV
jgi:hypothetical protein